MLCRLVLILMVALGLACGSASAPTSPAPSASPQPSPAPGFARYTVSGRVTDETGVSIAAATVEVQYPPPPGRFGAFVTTKTNDGGFYELAFDTDRPLNWVGLSNVAGVVNSFAAGYTPNSQLVPWGTPIFASNLRLHQARTIRAGESITVSIEADSSICSDQEDWFLSGNRCDSFTVLTDTAGTLSVEAREPGAIVPIIFSATSGWYARQQLGPGTVSLLQVRAGERYQLFVGVPNATVPRRYVVSTSVH
jgi:hypothetical protein